MMYFNVPGDYFYVIIRYTSFDEFPLQQSRSIVLECTYNDVIE